MVTFNDSKCNEKKTTKGDLDDSMGTPVAGDATIASLLSVQGRPLSRGEVFLLTCNFPPFP